MFLSIIVITFLTLVVYVWMTEPKKLDLPGPRGIPVLGYLLQMDKRCPQEHLARLAEKYGGVFCINLMRSNVVVVSSYEHLHEILIKKGIQFGNRPRTFRAYNISFGLKSLIVQNIHDHFLAVAKKATFRSLKLYSGGMEKIEQVISTMLEDFTLKMQKTGGKPHNPSIDIYNFTLQALLYFSLGKCVEDGDDIFVMGRQMERMRITAGSIAGSGAELDTFPWLRYFPNKYFRQTTEAKEITTALWEMVKPDLKPNPDGCVMESMLWIQQEELQQTGKLTIDDDNMKTLLADILVAGTTTTSNSLTAFLNILVHYPEVQAKLHQEVDAVVGSGRAVKTLDRQQMPYTRATIYELNRYVSIVTASVPHTTSEECELAGATIPKGTVVLANLWTLHHDETFWSDPWRFRPERFLDEQGELLPADHENRKHLLPFGAGPRVCVGELFAMTRMFLFIATVIQRFAIEAAPGEKVSCDPRSYFNGLVLSAPDYNICFMVRK